MIVCVFVLIVGSYAFFLSLLRSAVHPFFHPFVGVGSGRSSATSPSSSTLVHERGSEGELCSAKWRATNEGALL